jgi:hypothetical protein
MTDVKVVGLLGGVLILGVMVELLRRRQLKEKYAVLWLGVALSVAVLAAAPGLLDAVAGRLSVADPVNLLLFVGMLVLLSVCVHLSWECSRLEDETRSLAEEVALLRNQVEQREPPA